VVVHFIDSLARRADALRGKGWIFDKVTKQIVKAFP
jgi:hypothetical protein